MKHDFCNQLQTREALTRDFLGCEVRFTTAPGDDGAFEGVAVPFDTLDSYGTTFDRRAFAWDGQSLPALWSHIPNEVVGQVHTVAVEPDGLHIRGNLNLDIQRAREVRSMLTKGDIRGLSIGFQRLKDEARGRVRHITAAKLHEISFVAMPSIPGAHVKSVRTNSGDLAGFVEAVMACTNSLRRKV